MEPSLQRIEAVFTAALEIKDPEGRDALLDLECNGDIHLRNAVEELLGVHAGADRFFTQTSQAMQPPTTVINGRVFVDELEPEKPGACLGPYKLLQRLGEGGCGIVYMAAQEKPVRRRVALKIIKMGMDTKMVIGRFEGERHALAMMDHPNIARALDAGATQNGRPYFVMELVRGVRITDYCDQSEMDTRQRLELFIKVCHAIQHAHQKGVVHRDIKPSNILVTMHDGVPAPKVIDFGIAKATEGRLSDSTVFTGYEQVIGTPAYMSPEQAEMSGLDVDTRSDIYSLGVLLYELLAGRTPFETKELVKSGPEGIRRTLREREPQKPSAVITTMKGTALFKTARSRHVDPPKLISLLRGDLDWIVLRALEKDRTRRYQTANALAMDVQRFLDNEPISARPPSRFYRLQKLVRRNRGVFAAAAAVLVALLVGLSSSTWLFFQERAARQRAEIADQQHQAAFLISQGKLEEADEVIRKIPVPQPSLETEDVLRSLGTWHALQGRWFDAAERLGSLVKANQLDKSGTISSDLLLLGPTFIEGRDLKGYESFRRQAIARFDGTTDPVDAERVVKISLLLPIDTQTLKRLEPFAQTAESSLHIRGKKDHFEQIMISWRCLSLALMAYREGLASDAITWGEKANTKTPEVPARIATIHVINAMARHQLGQDVEARSELEQGRKMIEPQFAAGLKNGNGAEGWWYDWLFAQILLHEAQGMIDTIPPQIEAAPPHSA
jgi:serine/threonine protein kinase